MTPSIHVLSILDYICDANAFDAQNILEVDVAHLVPIRVLERLDEVCSVGIAHEKRAKRAASVRKHVDSQRMSRRLHDGISVLEKFGRTSVREFRVTPGRAI